jgi:phospholipid/cholesterol/gamma-HCH transport system substrate-binding protein
LLGTIDGIVQTNRRQVSDFLRVGLPQFVRFVEESQRLVISLDRLVDKIERDPARFLLGTQASEFRQ